MFFQFCLWLCRLRCSENQIGIRSVPTLCDWFKSSASALRLLHSCFHLIVNDGVVSEIRTLLSLDCKVLCFCLLLRLRRKWRPAFIPTVTWIFTNVRSKAESNIRLVIRTVILTPFGHSESKGDKYLITLMITDGIGLHSVLVLIINETVTKFPDRICVTTLIWLQQ